MNPPYKGLLLFAFTWLHLHGIFGTWQKLRVPKTFVQKDIVDFKPFISPAWFWQKLVIFLIADSWNVAMYETNVANLIIEYILLQEVCPSRKCIICVAPPEFLCQNGTSAKKTIFNQTIINCSVAIILNTKQYVPEYQPVLCSSRGSNPYSPDYKVCAINHQAKRSRCWYYKHHVV